jgi:tetratricopeptide (TPR) repeat protein
MLIPDQERSFKNFFVPLTTIKAIRIIFIVGFIVFFNMLFNGFVWDDKTYIIYNSSIHANFFTKDNPFNSLGQYRPFSAIYFSIVNTLFGMNSFPYHFIQLIIHITNAILIFILFKRFFNIQISVISSLVFLIHPIMVESVSYIAASGIPLFFLFGMIALLIQITENKHINNSKIFIIFILLLCSLFIRETAILFIFISILYIILFNKKQINKFIIGGSLTISLYLLLRLGIAKVYPIQSELVPIDGLSLPERLLNIPAIAFNYLKLFFFPDKLAIDQQWVIGHSDFHNFYLPMLFDIGAILFICLLGIYIYRKYKIYFNEFLFFSLWLLLGFAIHLQIFPLDMTVADRFFYFLMIGMLGVLAVGIKTIHIKKPYSYIKLINTIIITIVIIILILLGVRTIVRNTNWVDAKTLYKHDLLIEDNFDIENNLGVEYQMDNQNNDALFHFKRSVMLYPFETNYSNLGVIYSKLGDYKKAEYFHYKALHAKHYSYSEIPHKHDQTTYERLAFLLLLKNENKKAKDFLMTAIKDYPNDANLWCFLAISEYNLQNRNSALSSIQKAKSLVSDDRIDTIYTKIINGQAIELSP